MSLQRNAAGLVIVALVPLACSTSPSLPTRGEPTLEALRESPHASERITSLPQHIRAALGPPVATRFDLSNDRVEPTIPDEVRRRVVRAARVSLPLRAAGAVHLEDERSGMSVRFALRKARNTRVALGEGFAVYANALDGADVVHRVHAEGTEDFAIFPTRPRVEALEYDVDVSHVAGLRLVSGTLEFLDAGGSPRLRVAPPYVVDAGGTRHAAGLSVAGCAVDTNGTGPWGRAITAPGSHVCTVKITWSNVVYPAMVDPAWGATGSMIVPRWSHHAYPLPSLGKILVAGGTSGTPYAELYDPGGNGGVGTFAASGLDKTVIVVLASGKVMVSGEPPEIYDPVTGTSTPTGPTNGAGGWPVLLTSGKVLFVDGGLFDPAGNGGIGTFSIPGSLVTDRSACTLTALANGGLLVAAGHGLANPPLHGVRLSSAELYDPATNSFISAGSLGQTREGHAAVLLASGKVLILGGIVGAGRSSSNSAILYDPTTGTFGGTGSSVGRYWQASMVALPTGKVVVVGDTALTELYDPSANNGLGAFSSAGSMSMARPYHAVAALPSGRVLVTGGGDAPPGTTSAEILAGSVGDACVAAAGCSSGFCVDGVCCSTACDGACQACAGSKKQDGSADGTCGAAKAGPDPRNRCTPYLCGAQGCGTSCASSAACASFAACIDNQCVGLAANGSACKSASACKSGFCVDGVCCENACTGQCQSCGGGTCAEVTGVPQGGRPQCPSGSTCNGVSPNCATPPKPGEPPTSSSTSSGGSAECASSLDCASPAVCDVQGKCVAPTIVSAAGGCSMGRATDSGALSTLGLGVLAALLFLRHSDKKSGARSDAGKR